MIWSWWGKDRREQEEAHDFEGAAAVVHGHVAAAARVVAVVEQLAHKVLEREAAVLQHARLAVLGEDDVVRSERGGRPDRDTFLSRRDLGRCRRVVCQRSWTDGSGVWNWKSKKTHHVEAQPALSLCVKHYQVHDAH